jgi:hypothetical protein
MPPQPPIISGQPSGGTSSANCAQLQQDIARYQSLVDYLNRSLASTNGPLARHQIQNELATATRFLEDTQANYRHNCLPAPHPPPTFELDPWSMVTPFGIHLANGEWHTGSVNAVCPISRGRLLIGTEQGGLWMGELDGQGLPTTRCLSDRWPHWYFTCFAVDPANPDRVFAGCAGGGGGGVYVGNVGVSYDDWFFVPIPASLGEFTDVAAMIVLPGQRLLVAATGGGVAWTGIDAMPFTWRSDSSQPVLRLANLEGDAFLFIATNLAALVPGRSTLNTGQIGTGGFTGTPLPASAIQWVEHGNPANINPAQIASCRDQPGNAYCLGTLDDATGSGLLYIIRLQAGSATWTECAYATNKAPADLGALLDIPLVSGGGSPKSDTSIAVHPSNPLLISVGYKGGAFSRDGGANWIALSDLTGWHDDVHVMLFDGPSDSLYIPCDGGILRRTAISNAEAAPDVFDTSWNQTLPVVMLYSPGGLQGPEPFGNLALGAGIVAAGSQDNSDLWWDPLTTEWRRAGGGDGGMVAIHQDGADTYLVHGESLPSSTTWSQRQGGAMSAGKVLQLRLNWAAVDAGGMNPAYARPVPLQVGMVVGPASSPVIALASPKNSNIVYGAVFHDSFDIPLGTMTITDPAIEWTALGAIPAGEVITALEPYDAASLLVGTYSGRLFRVPLGGGSTELFFDTKPTTPIKGIASDGATIACFTVEPTTVLAHTHVGLLYVGRIGPDPLTLLHTALCPLNDGKSVFYAIAANRNSKFLRLSFALIANDHDVWVSNSPLGVLWHKWDSGLPAAVHGSDLVIAESAAGGEVWLSTYGRGLWRLPF